MHDTIPVADIMVTDVVTLSTDAAVPDAAIEMRDAGVSSVVVAEANHGTPVGIVTEGDFATELCHHPDLGDLDLEAVMSTPLETIAPDASIVEAVSTLRDAEIEHLPVVTENGSSSGDGTLEGGAPAADRTLEGIVTTTELTYYVPHLVHRRHARAERPPRRQVRTDTLYERDDWEFEYHGADESTVSVGDVARFSKAISPEDVEAFAEVTGDTNRVHLDEAYAAESRFGEPIAHGVLANGIVSAALARLPGLTIYLSQESSFLAPVSIGDRVTAECEVSEELGDSRYRIDTVVTDGDETVVLEGDAVVLVDALPAGADLEGSEAEAD